MASPVTSGTHSARLLTEGLAGLWGLELENYTNETDGLFEVRQSKKQFEDIQGQYGLYAAPVLLDGEDITYDSGGSGFTKRFTHVAYGLGVKVTREAIEDNLYLDLSATYTKQIAKAINESKEIVLTNIFNRHTTSGYVGADGVVLASASHVYATGGTYSNILSAAALSETSLEDQLIAVEGYQDDRGIPRMLTAQELVIPKELRFTAERILKSDKQNYTANNAINAIRNQGLLPKGYRVIRRLTSSTAHWIHTNADNGLVHYQRVAPAFESTIDFDNYNLKMKGRMRMSAGWIDPHCVHANAGA